jgi:hypothetical protein
MNLKDVVRECVDYITLAQDKVLASYEQSNGPLESVKGTGRTLANEERDNSLFALLVIFCN